MVIWGRCRRIATPVTARHDRRGGKVCSSDPHVVLRGPIAALVMGAGDAVRLDQHHLILGDGRVLDFEHLALAKPHGASRKSIRSCPASTRKASSLPKLCQGTRLRCGRS